MALIAVLGLLWATLWLLRADPALLAGTDLGGLVARLSGQAEAEGGSSAVRVGGAFTLVDEAGHTVDDQQYRGRWMLVYFGYTTCPDVCPTELQTMAAALSKLGALAQHVAALFITVDPKRDTPPVLAAYTKLFGPGLIGLTGSDQQIADVTREYRVYYAKVTPKGSSDYLMDHSSFVYLMDPQGRFVTLFNPATGADEMADDMRARMSGRS